uniref:Uncharacterized protein n=1 Tax=Arundo donax TaxID=35708 RepID=A0A0A9BNN9_ARUDO
MILALYPLLNR